MLLKLKTRIIGLPYGEKKTMTKC